MGALEAVMGIMALIVSVVAVGVLFVAAATLITVICMTLYALVKPPLNGIIEAWLDWFERRTGC